MVYRKHEEMADIDLYRVGVLERFEVAVDGLAVKVGSGMTYAHWVVVAS